MSWCHYSIIKRSWGIERQVLHGEFRVSGSDVFSWYMLWNIRIDLQKWHKSSLLKCNANKLWTWMNHFQTCIELSIIYPNFSLSFETSYIIFMSLPFLLWTLTLNKTLAQIDPSYEYQLIGYLIFLNFFSVSLCSCQCFERIS